MLFNVIVFIVLVGNTISQESEPDCEIEVDQPICSQRGTKLQKQAFQESCKIFLSFQDELVVNLVDGAEYTASDLMRGPTFYDETMSGYFQGQTILEIPQEDPNPYFTYQMWLFFPRQNEAEKPRTLCPVFQKGNENQNYPSLYFDMKHRLLHITIDQTLETADKVLISASRLQYNQWYYVSIVSTTSKTKLYVNGVLDNIKVFQSAPLANEAPLYVGNTPWLKDSCGMPFLLDKFQFYTEEIKAYFIQAQSQIAVQIEQSYIHFGCIGCSKEAAKGACIAGYHICTKLELYSGVYSLVRSLGWVDWGDYIWTYQDLLDSDKEQGLAVCCID